MDVILRELFHEKAADIEVAPSGLIIGCAPHCGYQPSDGAVSWQHCQVLIAGDRVTIRDLGSCRGTFVAGIRHNNECELKHGDILQIGLHFFFVDIPRRRQTKEHSGDGRSAVQAAS
jgi:pSer/pThr/pTyr-binding forkhead associated (FHA) protein